MIVFRAIAQPHLVIPRSGTYPVGTEAFSAAEVLTVLIGIPQQVREMLGEGYSLDNYQFKEYET